MTTYNLGLQKTALWVAPAGEAIDTVGITASGPGIRATQDDGVSPYVPPDGFLLAPARLVANAPWVAPGIMLAGEGGVSRAFLERATMCNYTHSLFRYSDLVNCLRITCPRDISLAIQVITYDI